MNYKIIGGDGKEYGPISGEQMRQWISEGRLNAQTMAQTEGGAGWQPLSNFPEFGLQASTVSAAAAPVKPPGSIKVFGIINIILGSLGVLCIPLSLVGLSFAAKQPNYHPQMSQSWMIVSMTIGLIGSVITLVSGVGLCRMKSWARKLAVYYAWFALAFSIVGIFVNMASSPDLSSMPTEQREMTKVVAVVSVVVSTLVSWTYNGLLLYFLTRKPVKQALGETT